MKKTALLFAGQGAQCVGMGRDLAQNYPSAQALFAQADAALGYPLSQICFEGPDDKLTQTEHAQPAIYLVGWIAFQLLLEKIPGLQFHATAGLSLGEFTALAAAQSLSFIDGLQLVRARGQFMQEACDTTQGGMAAVIGLDETATRKACDEAGAYLANLNCPGQLVISGPNDAIERACQLAKTAGARKAVPLPVAGAYHSPLMSTAQEKLQQTIQSVPLNNPTTTVISNVTAQPHNNHSSIRQSLVQQVTSPVRWEDSIRLLLAQGFTRFIELGPGKALSGFMKRIDKDAEILNIGDIPSLEATTQYLTANP
ncbi:MAG: S-malonyltransferase [Verrucomicrobiota bacterium]|jgi:[acyl-carrier-protein] S-malonyltransferase